MLSDVANTHFPRINLQYLPDDDLQCSFLDTRQNGVGGRQAMYTRRDDGIKSTALVFRRCAMLMMDAMLLPPPAQRQELLDTC